MAEELVHKICTPCRGGIPPLPAEAAQRLLAQTPGWELVQDATRIRRTFRFENFRRTLEFVNRVGALAEEQGHHPVITFGWGFCTIDLQTKKIKGLHENDFIMAARINALCT
jgi:4a-hydroxytetrahydrobiopterin dehydratase